VFDGGWSLASAEAVIVRDGADVPAFAEILGSLVDKGIVQITQTAFGLRFGLPASIRQLAAEKLAEAGGEELVVRSAHARFFLKFAEKSAQELRGSPSTEWLDRLEVDHHNVLAAIGTFLADPSTGFLALRTITALSRFFEARHAREWLEVFTTALNISAGERATTTLTAEALGVLGSLVSGPEQQRWLEDALAIVRKLGEKALTAEVLSSLSSCAFHDRDFVRCAESAEEAVSIARMVGDQGLLGRALVTRATAVSGEDLRGACTLSREAITALREAGDRSREAAATANLATFECYAGDLEPAALHYSEALLLAEELGSTPLLNDILGNMAELAVRKGDLVGAAELYSQALRGAHREGQRRSCTYLLLGLALCFSAMSGTQEEAATLCGAADAQNEQLGFPWEIWISHEREEGEAALRRSMHHQTFETAYAHGRSLALEDAVAFALKVAGKIPLPSLGPTNASKPTSQQSPVANDGVQRQEDGSHAPASHPRGRRPRAKRG
jgi:tetratricopeptide (TPR) repeat protein